MSMLRNFIALILRWTIVVPTFWLLRLARDQNFLRNLGDPRLKPNPLLAPLRFAGRLADYVANTIRVQFDDYALRQYHQFLAHHYGPKGRGYLSYTTLSEDQRHALYGAPPGRLAGFINAYGDLLAYGDGVTFLDAGCGRGQNIALLVDRFPNANIAGFDINKDAVEVVRTFCGSTNVDVRVGDLGADGILDTFGTNSVDHVLISHVFSVILGPGLNETRQVRRSIIGHLIRIAKRSVLIIDSPAITADPQRFEIEQSHRGVFHENCSRYFEGASGRLIRLECKDSVGLLFQKSQD